jgi:hypothetical protein
VTVKSLLYNSKLGVLQKKLGMLITGVLSSNHECKTEPVMYR